MKEQRNKTDKKGSALLVVLFVVMVVTVLSLGFLSQSDVELACGENMLLRVQMDYLAESGLEHAKGLILNPQDVVSEYFTGATGQQLVAGSDDYYDLEVVRDDSELTNRCNYIIDCNSYRLRNGEKIGRSNIRGELRLDPCIAYWAGSSTVVSEQITINGDVYCNGNLTNNGSIGGDVFADSLSGFGSITGQRYNISQADGVTSPGLNTDDFTASYEPDPNGNVELIDPNLVVGETFVIKGNLIVSGGSIKMTAQKNSPAMLVDGAVTVKNAARLEVNGLAQITGGISVDSGAEVKIFGALYMTGADGISGSGDVVITTEPIKASLGGDIGTFTPAAGAFFRSIERN